MPAFIQITDTHIVEKGHLVCGVSDTNAALRKAVNSINNRLPALGQIDCAIVTGDLTDNGTPEEYAHFAEIMADLKLPWIAIPGNHDNRNAMRNAFARQHWMPSFGPIQWLQDFGPFAVLGLDTLLEGAHHGELSAPAFTFVDEQLIKLAGKPLVVATHHPWMYSGIPEMDADNLRNGARLMELLEHYSGPIRMISGHVHRAITGQVGRVLCQISPSPCHSVNRDQRKDAVHSLALEPGAVTFFTWHDGAQSGLISDILSLEKSAPPVPFE
ncbi:MULTISPECIES: phosphodiesterase [Pacificibacter]|uniref:phosphodiesterase n=1 Tax=Pacificibacter TaxID=1042323 RepID=UPI001C0A4C06|nr:MULTISPECIES: phosphodiesterase [Pacificibacter]MBU2935554.1 phosphodiesterase [Pacificibacter marinus]MDO6614051.1 phosphodiesterase [Pacificibacter sp. 1_MG-2023]